MTSIRPTPPHATPAAQTGRVNGDPNREAGKLAAQRAFFAALGKAEAPLATAAPAAAPSAPPPKSTARLAEAPQKVLRPGSLVDIRV